MAILSLDNYLAAPKQRLPMAKTVDTSVSLFGLS